MSARTDKRRESIVSLTHTEIMLVLAVVILLLLLAKGFDLTESQKELADSKERIALLERTSGDSAEEEEERQEKVDLAEEVTEILVLGGTVTESSGKERQLGKQPAEDVRVLVEEKKRRDKMDEVIDDALARVEESSPEKSDSSPEDSDSRPQDDTDVNPEQQRTEKIIRMSEEVANAKEEAASAKEEADDLRRENEKLKETISVAEAAGKEKNGGAQGTSLGKKIGCEPCWRKSGIRQYYFAYKITYYAGGAFEISQHPDLRSGADIIGKALKGLPSLRDYPEGKISQNTLLSFGQRLAKEKNKLHGEECDLVVTLNDEASGKIIKFVRDDVGFCPII